MRRHGGMRRRRRLPEGTGSGEGHQKMRSGVLIRRHTMWENPIQTKFSQNGERPRDHLHHSLPLQALYSLLCQDHPESHQPDKDTNEPKTVRLQAASGR